jgi:hypothetical protein
MAYLPDLQRKWGLEKMAEKKTKKELEKDIKTLMAIIRFYSDQEVQTMADAIEHLEEIRKHDGPTKPR